MLWWLGLLRLLLLRLLLGVVLCRIPFRARCGAVCNRVVFTTAVETFTLCGFKSAVVLHAIRAEATAIV